MSVRTQYDRWHEERTGPAQHQEDSPWHRIVREYLPAVQDKRILEIACGRGGFTRDLAASGTRAVGADFSYSALKIAQKGVTSASLAQADATKLPFLAESFDIVVSCETIEHLPDPLSGLSEMARVCRPGGLLYLTTPNYFNLMGLYRVYDSVLGRPQRSEESQPYDTVWNFPEVRRLVRRAGWEILRTDGTVHQVPFPGRAPITLKIAEGSRRLRRSLAIFALHQFVMARKP